MQFSTFTYYCMSQGLLDPRTLEMIQNRSTLDEVVMAPSYILREAWQKGHPTWNSQTALSFSQFLSLSLSNLIEHENKEAGTCAIDE